MKRNILQGIEPISNRELIFLTAGTYLGIILNHMELWLVW